MACKLGGKKSRCVGYCRLHHCYITVDQLKERECLKKHCHHLRRDAHPYWKDRVESKNHRKERKERIAAELAKYGH